MGKFKIATGKLGIRIINSIARKLHLSLFDLGLSDAGYTKSYSLKASGELSFVQNELKKYFSLEKIPVIFDVGSNVGEYAILLRKYFPQAAIHCFEPNPKTFSELKKNMSQEKFLNNFALSDVPGNLELYYQADNATSVQASLDKNILKNIAGAKNVVSANVQVKTLDQYCSELGIEKIDFLKIDTEGFELETLKGALQLLASKKITCIQFEFNEVNIEKRRFIKDFYEILPDYDFYRLDENKMIPMGEWHVNHEVFRFQNIVAIIHM